MQTTTGEFIAFLRFCAERLNNGMTVSEIWNAYLERKEDTRENTEQ